MQKLVQQVCYSTLSKGKINNVDISRVEWLTSLCIALLNFLGKLLIENTDTMNQLELYTCFEVNIDCSII